MAALNDVRACASLVKVETVDQALVMVDRAYLALSEAVTFQSTRQVRNLAVAAAAYAREANDTRLLDRATELRTRAERKAGQMLAESAERGERASRESPKAQGKHVVARDMLPPPTLAQIGVTRDQSSKWQQVAALSDDEFEDALATTKAITHEISTPKVLRAVKQAQQRAHGVVIDADDESVAELPTPAAPTNDEQAIAFYNAVRALAGLTCVATQLRAALPPYQHFRITDNIDRALALLHEVRATWSAAAAARTTSVVVPMRHTLDEERQHVLDTADALLHAARALRKVYDANVSAFALIRVLTADQQAEIEAHLHPGMRFSRNLIEWLSSAQRGGVQ
jgi:hypothetical protein